MAKSWPVGLSALALVFSLVIPTEGAGQASANDLNRSDDSLLRPFQWRSIGPIGQGGRVDDIAVSANNPSVFYVGFATGGLWKTTNNGVTFSSIFDEYETASVGDIALAPSNPDIVWVGTGEANNRQSSSFGAGIYKSTNGGASFERMGLIETQTISRVIVHPTNPDVVWVAANGQLFGPNPERGVFKTTDGGRSWSKTLFVDENTGATDMVIDPSNPNRLFAATYQRRRTACCFVGGGPGSGIWRSDDGGESWDRLSGSGLPSGTMGRIALDMTAANPQVVYAQIEVAGDAAPPRSTAELAEYDRAVQAGEREPDPQAPGIWRSNDGGDSWEFRSNENGRPMYFSQIRVDPSNPETVFVVDQNVHRSLDGARTFEQLDGYGHVDQHALWINPNNSDHIMIGNDGSLDRSYDQGETWESFRGWDVAQPYHASVDMRRPYFVCTGLQDNGSWCGPSSVRGGPALEQDWYRVGGGDGFYTAVDPTDYAIVYRESQGGNMGRTNLRTGEAVSIRPRGPTDDNPSSNILPIPAVGTSIRFNWNTPMILSPHNPSVVYAGGNRFFKSLDRGNTWTMSDDLTKQVDRDAVELMGMENSLPRCNPRNRGEECILSRNDGVSQYSTIVSLSESRVQPGVIWAGTDDGNIQVSRDGGSTFAEVGQNVPGGTREYYVSRVEASHFDAGTAYASLDGHRSNDLAPYVFVTRDYGNSWTSISGNLPNSGNVNTVRQDPVNADLLYAGTEFGFFVSLDEGGTWESFMNGLPVTRIDDVLVHPRENDLVLATHGRGVWVMDDITPLQRISSDLVTEDFHFFEPREAVQWRNDPTKSRSVTGDQVWRGTTAPSGTAITYFLGQRASSVEIRITDLRTGETFRTLQGPGEPGLNRVQWDLRGNPPEGRGGRGGGGGGRGGGGGPTAQPGTFGITVSVAGQEQYHTVSVLEDVWMGQR